MHKPADLIEVNAAEIFKAENEAMGQLTSVITHGFIRSMVSTRRYYSGWKDKIEEQTFPIEQGSFKIT